PCEGAFHVRIADATEVDICGDVRGGGENLAVGDAFDVVLYGCTNILERVNDAFRRRTLAAADGRGALGSFTPAAFQLVEGRVELAPLTAGEKAPLESVLQPIVIDPFLAPCYLGARANDFESIQDGVMPRAVIGAFGDDSIEFLPIV